MYQLFRTDCKLSDYSTFGIGGFARYFYEVYDVQSLQQVIRFAAAEHLPYIVIGKGSNSLFSDKGCNGLVILNKIHFYEEEENGLIHVGAGFSFSLLGTKTAKNGWSGLEFAAGIPGSVGGAIWMNAGAQGSEVANVVEAVDFVDVQGDLHSFSKEKLSFSYRKSIFQSLPAVITAARFRLVPHEEARKKQRDLLQYRIDTQPYSDKSCGCVFKNPLGTSAGMLIEKAGLKGLTIGGASVSSMHANFIVNNANATADDVLQLIQCVKQSVLREYGIHLESEIRIIPYNIP